MSKLFKGAIEKTKSLPHSASTAATSTSNFRFCLSNIQVAPLTLVKQ